LNSGVQRVVIGSMAVEDEGFITAMAMQFGNKLAVSVDAKGDMVATRGWVGDSDKSVIPFVQFLLSIGITTIVYTDISRDGMLSGPNMDMMAQLQALPQIQLIASGGVSGIDDLRALQQLGVYGAITGKALYEGKVTMEEINTL
jgi:phosphoribosylformimino-5-aminoimidazole carboxamide ribotide isomerase